MERIVSNILLIVFCSIIVQACAKEDKAKSGTIVQLGKASELDINVTDNALGEFLGEIVVDEENGYLYGVDLRARTAYRIALETGEATSLAPEGRGPHELSMPVQIAIGENGIKIYDNSQNVIALHDGEAVVGKFPAYGEHGIWPRGYAAYEWQGELITAIEDHEHVRAMEFDEASPLAFLNYRDGELWKAGRFPSTIDEIDTENKYSLIYLDEEEGKVYYMLRTDYTLMKYDLYSEETNEVAGYRHEKYRERKQSRQSGQNGSVQAAMALGTSMSQVIGINRIGDKIIVVWQNYNEGFYENQGDDSPGNVDYFGVGYDLSEPGDVVEFELPGRFLGVYDNQLMIEENMGAAELVIGFYDFEE